MKKKIKTVLKSISQQELADQMGCTQPRISQLAKLPDAMVVFDGQGQIICIEYNKMVQFKKRKEGANEEI